MPVSVVGEKEGDIYVILKRLERAMSRRQWSEVLQAYNELQLAMSNSNAKWAPVVFCKCGIKATLKEKKDKTAWFYLCSKYPNGQCKFFQWFDA